MTRTEAHELLDAARAGVEVSMAAITDALRATGDMDSSWQRRTVRAARIAWPVLPSRIVQVDLPARPALRPRRSQPYSRAPVTA